jgi:nanoRNase/pAp phosphatase (c-di-AMP/oligoRNAs hydrolase)
VRAIDGKGKQNMVFACGHSILNRTCKSNIGSLMLRYGGGGHAAVGTCQVPHQDAERVLGEIVDQLKTDECRPGVPAREAVSAA